MFFGLQYVIAALCVKCSDFMLCIDEFCAAYVSAFKKFKSKRDNKKTFQSSGLYL